METFVWMMFAWSLIGGIGFFCIIDNTVMTRASDRRLWGITIIGGPFIWFMLLVGIFSDKVGEWINS